jgi:hypothetical protein
MHLTYTWSIGEQSRLLCEHLVVFVTKHQYPIYLFYWLHRDRFKFQQCIIVLMDPNF